MKLAYLAEHKVSLDPEEHLLKENSSRLVLDLRQARLPSGR